MNSSKLRQFAFSLCVVLSLFASSLAACGCAHHQEKVETDAHSCHQNSTAPHSDEMPMQMPDAANFAQGDDCLCIQSAPRVFAKSDIVKIEKQPAAIAPCVSLSIKTVALINKAETVYRAKPLYLSDSFYNIKSPRAPPRL